ncbi:alpha/beta fold hydrolase [Candidatus Chloroploca sp. Khr17]|uniref:alpha/beta fold hydrolase n=1 Tax=Candidatus Chloroploca sp. Khr17 TaxID=2496869 RepID=UPI00101C4C15|nr:alpha/beta fold hydrolase [Candidatus Chloroploca sp. Khr17]
MSNSAWINREEYPFASQFFSVPAGRMHYVDEGSGEPIVMIHGNPTWSFLYRNLIKRLQPEYRCIAMDHLGFGLSDKPEQWSYLPKDHAANLTAFIEGLGLQKITLVMQDWGGPLGLSYALNHPANVARIVIINTWAWPVNRDPYYIAFSGIMGGPIGRVLIMRYNFFAWSVLRQSFGDKRKLSREAHRHYLQHLATPAERIGCHVFPGQIVGSSAWLGEIWERMDTVEALPKLIVWGMKDIAFRPKELRRWQARFPSARTVELATVGHYVQEEAPDDLAAAMLPFLREPARA